MKVSHPEKDGNGQVLKLNNQFGKKLINHFNSWRGGVHIDCSKKEILAIADGRIIANRLFKDYEQ